MAKRVGIEVSIAVAEAVKLADVDLVAAYPITPQTHIVEHLSEDVANGKLDAEFVPVESEHSAMSCCCGSSAAGARTFTASSSQGLSLMSEILYIPSTMRLPIVMVVANRALSAPISIWNDHQDIMVQRDIGWIQTFAENGQEAFDLTLHAFRVAEDRRVSLPMIVNIDGFTLSHVIEPIEILDQEEVNRYLPPFKPRYRLDPKKPITMGPVGIPEVYTEAKVAHDQALKASKKVILKAWDEFAELFGRRYQPVETYRSEDAETLLVTMGSISETAMTAVDAMREKGQKVGLVRIRLWRPFPAQEFRKAAGKAKVLAVIDRCLPPGAPCGPVGEDLRAVFYKVPGAPKIFSFVAGLGGRDVTVETFEEIVEKAQAKARKRPRELYEVIGVREK
ncbi:pyruvate ferredoxin oxidoreductase [Dissulfurirhabdus thermomarina]|uniref:Pyruvate ferredoxin oxidoreductase n=1 Tax=Dissulfurirhabdus thermomarina TaxID=1765737 RepID=A0A6N9TPS3_DISTH|nr:transketolase C-terminal domain-containing protein [Dissulfurirhabdus thermomarina]NDY42103.1 pyruvate ferredoxin oxidoreductase [Dissulfurirhabdus thermomarina]NMX22485.1 pyruvate ferredoxin oxidoreductase [Dissulfurirhabdus thermomarina]